MSIPMPTQTRDQALPELQTPNVSNREGLSLGNLPLYLTLFLLSAMFTIPFVWLIMTSLKPPEEVFAGGLLPTTWTAQNYRDILNDVPFARWMLNTAVVSVLAVVAVVISSSLVAYGFSRIRFPGRKQLFAILIATYLLPGSVTLIPTFLIWNELGAVNTIWPLWAANIFGSAFYIFMLRQFMFSVPQDLIDAARLDGASFFRIYWNIMLPLMKPALVAVAIFEFGAKWNDLMTPLIYLNTPDRYTLALGLSSLKTDYEALGTQWGLLMAASVIFTIPMIIIFFLFQRYFMEGIATTGIKG
ncbi:MAG: carbohydrate ABC transporter permease [Chloroflexia bacterium]|nr:carbohydrate ABC transporter permease [Chloroflexia bacterium]